MSHQRSAHQLPCIIVHLCRAAALMLWCVRFAPAAESQPLALSSAVQARCLDLLQTGLRGKEFWPAMHAAEGLTQAGHREEVLKALSSRMSSETDDQRRCGLARELARAGDRSQARLLLEILAGSNSHGHVHAAESLYKIAEVGDGVALRHAFQQSGDLRLRLMAAGALARCGNPSALRFLRDRLGDDDPQQARIAAWILGSIGSANDIPGLRHGLQGTSDEMTRAFFEHALAALGDTAGREALGKNLHSPNATIRALAANVAGEARLLEFAPALEMLLDDADQDVRIRTAQALLSVSGPPRPDSREDISVLVYEANARNPRSTEGSVLALNDGTLLYAVSEFQADSSDFAQAQIVARESRDGGRSWGPPCTLQENSGGLNVMSVTLRRLRPPAADGTIALFYLEKNGYDNLNLLLRISRDEARTFGPPIRVTADAGYHVVNNDRILQLESGRLLAPAASTPDVQKQGHFVSHCYLSDDGGQSWRNGQGIVDVEKRGAMEPEVIELTDGRVLMLIRTQLGYIARSISRDGGETWSPPTSLGIRAPEAPATLRRIPSTGDLVLIWNDTYTPGADHGGRRTPLTVALSSDEGETWRTVGNLESDPNKTFSYTSLIFVGDRAVMSYWESGPQPAWLSSRFRSLPVSWFYREHD